MAQYRKNRMSLYEAMTRSRRKGSYGRLLEKLHAPAASPLRGKTAGEQESATEKTGLSADLSGVAKAKTEAKSDVAMPMMTATWLRRPRTVQFNISRIEFSLSYPVAIAIVLGLILLALLAFRAGQYYSFMSKQPTGNSVPAKPRPTASIVNPPSSVAGRETSPVETKVEFVKAESAVAAGGPATPKAGLSADLSGVAEAKSEASAKAGNVIVIVEYSKRADLVPVQRHFAKFGIETEIVSWGGKCFLITKNRFKDFGAGSDGYEAKQKIVEVGAKYKAPEGYETFAPLFFKDAYGRKVADAP